MTTSPQFTKTYQNQFSRWCMHAPSTKRTAEKSYIIISSPTPSPADASRTLPALLPDAGTLLGTSGPVHQPYPSHTVRVESLVLKGITRVEGTSLSFRTKIWLLGSFLHTEEPAALGVHTWGIEARDCRCCHEVRLYAPRLGFTFASFSP